MEKCAMNEYTIYNRVSAGKPLSSEETAHLIALQNDLETLLVHEADDPLPSLITQDYQTWLTNSDFDPSKDGESQVGLGGPIYDFLYSKTVDVNKNRLDDFNLKDENNNNILNDQGNPISNGVSDWLNGAKEVNANSNFQGGFIQHYTNFQYELRIEDNEAAAIAKGQEASNLIAFNVADDIIFHGGKFPDITTLGVIDAGAAASTRI